MNAEKNRYGNLNHFTVVIARGVSLLYVLRERYHYRYHCVTQHTPTCPGDAPANTNTYQLHI